MLMGNLVQLEKLGEANLDLYLRWINNPRLNQWLFSREPISWDNAYTKIVKKSTPTNFYFLIRAQESGQPVGYLLLGAINYKFGRGSIRRIVVDEAHQRKGYATEGINIALWFAFNELRLHRVEARVYSPNTPSVALFKKLGFHHCGTLREALFRNGNYYDVLVFDILDRELAYSLNRSDH